MLTQQHNSNINWHIRGLRCAVKIINFNSS